MLAQEKYIPLPIASSLSQDIVSQSLGSTFKKNQSPTMISKNCASTK